MENRIKAGVLTISDKGSRGERKDESGSMAAGMLEDAGFEELRIRPRDENREMVREWVPGNPIRDYVLSAMIEAVKR